MSAHTIPALKALGLTMALIFGALAHAADPVTEAMQAANGPYRMALFKTNGKSQPEALQALTQAQQAWDKLSTQFGGKPAAPYDRLLTMTAQTGTLSYLAKRLTTQAPASLTQNPEFTALVGAVNQSVSALESAVMNQDMPATKEAMGKLKGPYSKLFAKFG